MSFETLCKQCGMCKNKMLKEFCKIKYKNNPAMWKNLFLLPILSSRRQKQDPREIFTIEFFSFIFCESPHGLCSLKKACPGAMSTVCYQIFANKIGIDVKTEKTIKRSAGKITKKSAEYIIITSNFDSELKQMGIKI